MSTFPIFLILEALYASDAQDIHFFGRFILPLYHYAYVIDVGTRIIGFVQKELKFPFFFFFVTSRWIGEPRLGLRSSMSKWHPHALRIQLKSAIQF